MIFWLVAALGWLLAALLGCVELSRHGSRYVLRAYLWRLRAPLGHRNHTIIGNLRSGNMLGYWMASCECGFAERGISRPGADGALKHHLRHARPWVHYQGQEPCPGESEHGVLEPIDAQFLLDHEQQLAALSNGAVAEAAEGVASAAVTDF
jgi:hypothetical protein